MRMSREDKELSHARIVSSAAALVRRRGIAGASVNEIMEDAGLTHGGFYKHFDSKEALLDAALDSAFDEFASRLHRDRTATATLQAEFRRFYLSRGHVATPEQGCPIAALAGDVGRASADLKARFGSGVRRIVDLLGRGSGSAEARRARAIRQLVMMAGAVTIARACDPETAAQVLEACRDGA